MFTFRRRPSVQNGMLHSRALDSKPQKLPPITPNAGNRPSQLASLLPKPKRIVFFDKVTFPTEKYLLSQQHFNYHGDFILQCHPNPVSYTRVILYKA